MSAYVPASVASVTLSRRATTKRVPLGLAVWLAAAATFSVAQSSLVRLGPPTQVIVRTLPGVATSVVVGEIEALGGNVTRTLGIIHGLAATVPADRITQLHTTFGVASVTLDGPLHLLSTDTSYVPTSDTGSIYNTTSMTGAQSYWSAGYTGQGVDVAIIDSGAVPVNGLNAPGKTLYGPDLSFDSQARNLVNRDTFGHGTHLAGIVGGRDNAAVPGHYAGDSTNFIGMAPDSRIVAVKVADSHGVTDVSQVLSAIDWVVQHHADPGMNIRVLNLSFGTDSYQSYVDDPLAFAVETAWHAGIVVVGAAGNAGWTTGLVDPAVDPYVIAVGSSDTKGTNTLTSHTVATFSAGGSGNRNPDLVAPGIHMVSLRDPNSYVDANYPSGYVTSRLFRGSGTSQATAVVSGAAALLLSQSPNLTPDQVKNLLTSTATYLPGQPAILQGAGELNLRNALYAVPATAVQAWAPSTGTGSLEGARGSAHLSWNGVQLKGEADIFGSPVNTADLAKALANGTVWTGGAFNGVVWTGSGWVGDTWASNSWSSNSWSSNSWSSNSWSSNSWSSNSWSSNSWSSNSWSSNSWSSNSWSSNSWS